MAPNPIHFIDTVTSPYSVGKNVCFSTCAVTSSAMFRKTTVSKSLCGGESDMTERVSDILLMFFFSLFFSAPCFLSLLMLFVFSLQMRAGILVKKNKNWVICVSENEVKKYERPEVKSIISWPAVAYQIMSSHWWVMSRVFHSSFSGLKIHHDCWNHPIGNIPSLLQRILINAKWLALWVSCVIVYYPLLNSVCCLQNKGANVSTP